MGAMYRVFALRLAPNFEVPSAADKKFYLQLTVRKLRVPVVLTKKYLRLDDYSDTNLTAAVDCENRKIETLSGIIDTKIVYRNTWLGN